MNGGQVIFVDELIGVFDMKSGQDVICILYELNVFGYMIVIVMYDKVVVCYVWCIIEISDGEIVVDWLNCYYVEVFVEVGIGVVDVVEMVVEMVLLFVLYDVLLFVDIDFGLCVFCFVVGIGCFVEVCWMVWIVFVLYWLCMLLMMFGIIIGIMLVVLIVVVGEGVKCYMFEEIGSIGINMISFYLGVDWGDSCVDMIQMFVFVDVVVFVE